MNTFHEISFRTSVVPFMGDTLHLL